MRVILLLALTATAAADPPRVTWGDWVGSYAGKLAWSSCVTPGNATATLALDATDGVMAIELAPALSSLRTMTLVDEDGTWAAQQGDVKVHVRRGRPASRIDVAVELESGCRMTGHLERKVTVPACDALVGWSRIQARCTKLAAPLEDAGKLAATKWKPADAGQCAARTAKLELALVDAGCAPHPDPFIGVRARDCLELANASAKLSRCGNVPREVKDVIVVEAQALGAAAQSADKASLPYVEQQCRDTKAAIATIATRFSCSP